MVPQMMICLVLMARAEAEMYPSFVLESRHQNGGEWQRSPVEKPTAMLTGHATASNLCDRIKRPSQAFSRLTVKTQKAEQCAPHIMSN